MVVPLKSLILLLKEAVRSFVAKNIPLFVHMAEEMDEKVTKDEAQEILEEIEDNIDSEMGVSWTSIRVGISSETLVNILLVL